MTDLVQQLASELAVRPNQVEAAIKLIDEGSSVPFIARYRKEVTQGLDDIQLRQLDTRLVYLRDLFERREKVIESLKEQNKLSDDLLARVNAAETKNALEELYAPYRPKRTSKSFKAKEAGLGVIAEKIIAEQVDPTEALAGFSHEEYPDVESQLDAIQHIIIDDWAQNIPLTTELKTTFAKTAVLKSLVASEEKKKSVRNSVITLISLKTSTKYLHIVYWRCCVVVKKMCLVLKLMVKIMHHFHVLKPNIILRQFNHNLVKTF